MRRDYGLYLDDIVQAIGCIREYVAGTDEEQFKSDRKTRDAVIRNLEVIGEASRNLPETLKEAIAEVDWRKVVGLRDILAHEYFGVSIPILWDVVQNKLESLESVCQRMLRQLREQEGKNSTD